MRARRAVTHGASWRRHPSSQCPIGVPYELLKFAPKKVRGDGIPTEQSGGPIVEMLQSAGQQLRAAISSKRRSSTCRTARWLKRDLGEARWAGHSYPFQDRRLRLVDAFWIASAPSECRG